jgi:hypothetical protein
MDKSSLPTLDMIRQAAASSLRRMNDELQMLMSSFPNLRDAFDPDDLPVEFILKRDSHLEPVASRVLSVSSAAPSTSGKVSAHDIEHRREQRKPASGQHRLPAH